MASPRRNLAVAALLIALSACTESNVSRDADITIGGAVQRQDGSLAKQSRVVLTREADIGELLTTGLFVGLPCLVEDSPPICKGADIDETGDDARFMFQLKGSDTQGLAGQASTLVLSSSLARGQGEVAGPTVTKRFQVQTNALEIPLAIWEPPVQFSGDGRTGVVNWGELPASLLPGEADLSLVDTSVIFLQENVLVWGILDARSGAPFDERLLEDSTGSVSVHRRLNGVNVNDSAGRKVDIAFRSASLAYEGRAGKPVSRDRPCFTAIGKEPARALQNCTLTNGRFDRPPSVTAPPVIGASPPPAQFTYVDLGAPKEIDLVVIRGCGGPCPVQVSNDARSWQDFAGTAAAGGESDGSNLTVQVDSARTARFVGVNASTTSQLIEISAWPPAPKVATESQVARNSATGEFEESKPGLLRWITLALLLAVCLAASVILLRRGRHGLIRNVSGILLATQRRLH